MAKKATRWCGDDAISGTSTRGGDAFERIIGDAEGVSAPSPTCGTT